MLIYINQKSRRPSSELAFYLFHTVFVVLIFFGDVYHPPEKQMAQPITRVNANLFYNFLQNGIGGNALDFVRKWMDKKDAQAFDAERYTLGVILAMGGYVLGNERRLYFGGVADFFRHAHQMGKVDLRPHTFFSECMTRVGPRKQDDPNIELVDIGHGVSVPLVHLADRTELTNYQEFNEGFPDHYRSLVNASVFNVHIFMGKGPVVNRGVLKACVDAWAPPQAAPDAAAGMQPPPPPPPPSSASAAPHGVIAAAPPGGGAIMGQANAPPIIISLDSDDEGAPGSPPRSQVADYRRVRGNSRSSSPINTDPPPPPRARSIIDAARGGGDVPEIKPEPEIAPALMAMEALYQQAIQDKRELERRIEAGGGGTSGRSFLREDDDGRQIFDEILRFVIDVIAFLVAINVRFMFLPMNAGEVFIMLADTFYKLIAMVMDRVYPGNNYCDQLELMRRAEAARVRRYRRRMYRLWVSIRRASAWKKRAEARQAKKQQ